MNIYTIYAELAEGVKPKEFVDSITEYFNTLPQLHAFRITRMKLGFRSSNLGEWRIDMEFKTMQDLDDAMDRVLYAKDTMQAHISFAKLVDADSLDHFLYRDWPDEKI
tara:strand:+ start:1466 stop:1789 length:324 start_codon:yes stop_codon:yes gene_type:complete